MAEKQEMKEHKVGKSCERGSGKDETQVQVLIFRTRGSCRVPPAGGSDKAACHTGEVGDSGKINDAPRVQRHVPQLKYFL